MKIAVAQTRPIKGDIDKNISAHLAFIHTAIANKVDAIFFPELSITGYEPALAHELSIDGYDHRFEVFQTISNSNKITIGIGVPTQKKDDLYISMFIFQPNLPMLIYSKQHLHPGEELFFKEGNEQLFIDLKSHKIAPAICYESSVPAHNHHAINNGADIYVASVLNTVTGVDKELSNLASIAKNHGIIVLMSNFVGHSGGYEAGGKSSIWNKEAKLIGALDNHQEGLLIYNLDTHLTQIIIQQTSLN